MEEKNKDRLIEILELLQEIGDEIQNPLFAQDGIDYELSEIGSSLVDARVMLRKIIDR